MKTEGIVVKSWAAWAPGIESHEQWSLWANGTLQPGLDGIPDVKFFPAMMRRRLSRLGKMAAAVVHRCCDNQSPGYGRRFVFASRYGEQQRTQRILEGLTKEGDVSPTAFSLSVHNAIAGLLSIAHKDEAPSVSIAAGRDTFSTAWVEASGLLISPREQCEEVVLVYYDEPLTDEYAEFNDDELTFPFALALSLQLAPKAVSNKALPVESLYLTSLSEDRGDSATSQPLDFMRVFLNNKESQRAGYGSRWIWK